MDPLSITASIVAVLQLTSTLIEYTSSVKDASKDRAQCANEALNLYNLLFRLSSRLEEANSTISGMRRSGTSRLKMDPSINTSMRWSCCCLRWRVQVESRISAMPFYGSLAKRRLGIYF